MGYKIFTQSWKFDSGMTVCGECKLGTT